MRWWVLVGLRGRGRLETGPDVRNGKDGRVGDAEVRGKCEE